MPEWAMLSNCSRSLHTHTQHDHCLERYVCVWALSCARRVCLRVFVTVYACLRWGGAWLTRRESRISEGWDGGVINREMCSGLRGWLTNGWKYCHHIHKWILFSSLLFSSLLFSSLLMDLSRLLIRQQRIINLIFYKMFFFITTLSSLFCCVFFVRSTF